MMGFIQDQQSLSAKIPQRITKTGHVGLVDHQGMRDDEPRPGRPRICRVAALAPECGQIVAIDQRGLASRFEHRLFLSATPHNGHSNSFSSLLEILDPQRLTRGVSVRPGELDTVMVRRLKSDLRHFGEKFPERVVEPILLDGLWDDSPELVL
jgi:hypothetical protein